MKTGNLIQEYPETGTTGVLLFREGVAPVKSYQVLPDGYKVRRVQFREE